MNHRQRLAGCRELVDSRRERGRGCGVDYEKIGHGSLKLAVGTVNLRSLVDGVVEMAVLNNGCPPEVEVFCDIDDATPHLLRVDPVRLRYQLPVSSG